MGKKILLFGADYSTNGIQSCYADNNGLSVTNIDGGRLINQGQSLTRANIRADEEGHPIKVPAKSYIILFGLTNTDGDTLEVDYCAFSSGDVIPVKQTGDGVNPNLIHTGSNFVSANYFPFNRLNNPREQSIIVTNNSDDDIWIGFMLRMNAQNADVKLEKFNFSCIVLPLE